LPGRDRDAFDSARLRVLWSVAWAEGRSRAEVGALVGLPLDAAPIEVDPGRSHREHEIARLRPGHFVPGAPVEFSTGAVFLGAAPLFEKERYPCGATLIADVGHPAVLHRPSRWA